jgi:hypothetical protein
MVFGRNLSLALCRICLGLCVESGLGFGRNLSWSLGGICLGLWVESVLGFGWNLFWALRRICFGLWMEPVLGDFTYIDLHTHYIQSVLVQDFVSGRACCVN